MRKIVISLFCLLSFSIPTVTRADNLAATVSSAEGQTDQANTASSPTAAEPAAVVAEDKTTPDKSSSKDDKAATADKPVAKDDKAASSDKPLASSDKPESDTKVIKPTPKPGNADKPLKADTQSVAEKKTTVVIPPKPVAPPAQQAVIVKTPETTKVIVEHSGDDKHRHSFTQFLSSVKDQVKASEELRSSSSPQVIVQQPQTSHFEAVHPRSIKVVESPKVLVIEPSHSDRLKYKERELRDRELRLRELELKAREEQLSQRERAVREREWYERVVAQDWQDAPARDREINYLRWRDSQIKRATWVEDGQLCRFDTYYAKGVRVNRKVTVCKNVHGVRKCYHPRRYYIRPVSQIVCRPIVAPRVRVFHRY